MTKTHNLFFPFAEIIKHTVKHGQSRNWRSNAKITASCERGRRGREFEKDLCFQHVKTQGHKELCGWNTLSLPAAPALQLSARKPKLQSFCRRRKPCVSQAACISLSVLWICRPLEAQPLTHIIGGSRSFRRLWRLYFVLRLGSIYLNEAIRNLPGKADWDPHSFI